MAEQSKRLPDCRSANSMRDRIQLALKKLADKANDRDTNALLRQYLGDRLLSQLQAYDPDRFVLTGSGAMKAHGVARRERRATLILPTQSLSLARSRLMPSRPDWKRYLT
jgi:hypothetical protein